MVVALLFVSAVASLAALVAKDRERLRATMALDAERRAHDLTRSECDGLRAALERAALERARLENEAAELRALGSGGPFRSS